MPVNRLRWKDWSVSEHGQRIYRSLEPIDVNNLPPVYATLPPNVEYFEDDNILVGVKYHYLVSAFKDDIEKFSDPISIDTSNSPLGPGPEDLIGNNESAGFFGEVSDSELVTGSDLASMLDMGHIGRTVRASSPWLKFVLDNKILFVAKMPFKDSISWNDLNVRGAVYGERVLYLQGYAYKVRLLTGRNPDSTVPYSSGSDTPYTHNSEWNRLMYNITADSVAYPKNSQIGENWANYTMVNLGQSSSYRYRNICQDYNNGQVVIRGYSYSGDITNVSHVASSHTSNDHQWRPVLELITT